MRSGQFNQFVEEPITILTDGERIEGKLFHMGEIRLSDFLNSSAQQDARFLKVKDPTVYCRRSGEELIKVPFLMVSRERIVMLMTHAPEPDPEDEADSFGSTPRRLGRVH